MRGCAAHARVVLRMSVQLQYMRVWRSLATVAPVAKEQPTEHWTPAAAGCGVPRHLDNNQKPAKRGSGTRATTGVLRRRFTGFSPRLSTTEDANVGGDYATGAADALMAPVPSLRHCRGVVMLPMPSSGYMSLYCRGCC